MFGFFKRKQNLCEQHSDTKGQESLEVSEFAKSVAESLMNDTNRWTHVKEYTNEGWGHQSFVTHKWVDSITGIELTLGYHRQVVGMREYIRVPLARCKGEILWQERDDAEHVGESLQKRFERDVEAKKQQKRDEFMSTI